MDPPLQMIRWVKRLPLFIKKTLFLCKARITYTFSAFMVIISQDIHEVFVGGAKFYKWCLHSSDINLIAAFTWPQCRKTYHRYQYTRSVRTLSQLCQMSYFLIGFWLLPVILLRYWRVSWICLQQKSNIRSHWGTKFCAIQWPCVSMILASMSTTQVLQSLIR